MDRNVDVFETPGINQDVLAPRSWMTDELAAVAESQRDLLKAPLTSVPDEVPRGICAQWTV